MCVCVCVGKIETNGCLGPGSPTPNNLEDFEGGEEEYPCKIEYIMPSFK